MSPIYHFGIKDHLGSKSPRDALFKAAGGSGNGFVGVVLVDGWRAATDIILEVWGRACALRVAHLWREAAWTEETWRAHVRSQGGIDFDDRAWVRACAHLWADYGGSDWVREATDMATRTARTEISLSADAARLACSAYPIEALAASSAAVDAHNAMMDRITGDSERVPPDEDAMRSMSHESEIDVQDDMLRALISLLMHIDGVGEFKASPHLDWWWYYMLLGGFHRKSTRREWLITEGSSALLERLRGEDSTALRRVLIHAWHMQGGDDWDIVWARR